MCMLTDVMTGLTSSVISGKSYNVKGLDNFSWTVG